MNIEEAIFDDVWVSMRSSVSDSMWNSVWSSVSVWDIAIVVIDNIRDPARESVDIALVNAVDNSINDYEY